MEVLSVNGARCGMVAAAAALLAACDPGPRVTLDPQRTLSAPTQVGTAPMIAVAPRGTLASAWISAPGGSTDGRLYLQVDSGSVVEIRDSLGPIAPHGEAPPKLAWSADSAINAIYVVARDEATARFPLTALRFIRSTDDGKTWSAPITVTSDAEFGAHSFHALHVGQDGTIYVSWLGGDPGKAAAWLTWSTDHGRSWAPRVRVDSGNACPCCRTGIATANDGTLYMAWRHIYPGNIRDVVVARSTDHGANWSAPVRVHADEWKFDGCPHAGPSLAVDGSGAIHIAWWTGKDKAAGVWYARSSDRGATFSDPVAISVGDLSRPAHVQLALGETNVVAIAWDDGIAKVPRIALRVSQDGGRVFGQREWVSGSSMSATFPVLALAENRMTIAWSEQAGGKVDTMPMPNMKDPKAHKGLEAVGEGVVVLRNGRIAGDR